MAASKEEMKKWLEELEDYTLEQEEMQQRAMAIALVQALTVMEESGDMWKTVEIMLNMDEELVTKLEFTIASVFVEKHLAQGKGGRYAN